MLEQGAYLILPAPPQCAGTTRKGIKRKMTNVYIAGLRILRDIEVPAPNSLGLLYQVITGSIFAASKDSTTS